MVFSGKFVQDDIAYVHEDFVGILECHVVVTSGFGLALLEPIIFGRLNGVLNICVCICICICICIIICPRSMARKGNE
jgi:hypothetical protein